MADPLSAYHNLRAVEIVKPTPAATVPKGQGSGAPAISSPPSAGAAKFLDTIGIDIETREIQAYLLDLTQGTAATVHGRSGAPAISPPPSAALPNSWIPSV
ncbi:MAG: hypothetical protein GY757_25170, partial [bacterium]|nr:hypothetical protein [bacterium]